jgi:hypothetical protein
MDDYNAKPQPNNPNYQPHIAVMIDSLDGMSKKLDELVKAANKAPNYKYEMVTLDTSGSFIFDNKGYPYFGFWAGMELDGSGQQVQPTYTITANVNGLIIPLPIKAGFNPLPIPQNAQLAITPSEHAAVTFLAMWHTDLLQL